MPTVTAKIRIGPDHRITGVAPDEAPEGEHEVQIVMPVQPKTQTFRAKDLPIHDLPWDDSISLRREDMYGDDGR